jgi:hypothetical protein
MARLVLTKGDVTLDQSGSGLVIGRTVNTGDNNGTILLLAGRVNGEVRAVFGPGAAAVFGATFAVALTLILWIRRRLF